VTHEIAADAQAVEGAVGGADHLVVDLGKAAPGRRGLAHVAQRAAVEQEVPDVRGVELLLVIEGARSRADPDPAVSGHDRLDQLHLPGDMVL
jgi:hypothetical protein